MKAWVLHRAGDIRYEEQNKPELSDEEVLIRVKAAGICGSDIPRIYEQGAHTMPLIPGHEFAGEVISAGSGADQRWRGKRVGVFPLIPCGNCRPCRMGRYEMCTNYSYLGSRKNGGFGEYAAVPVTNLLELPETVSYQEAAMLEPMAVAVHAIRRVDLTGAMAVAVCGLGTIGQLVTMFLLEMGIKNILVFGKGDFQRQSVMSMGIPKDNYCDSSRQNGKEWLMLRTQGYGADVFFECTGRNETVSLAIELTAFAGKVCMIGNPFSDMTLKKDIYWNLLRRQLTVTGSWNSSFGGDGPDDWAYVMQRLKQKKISPSALISHQMPLEELCRGLGMMRDKTEYYTKIMVVSENRKI